jgi:hypothetical protein
VEIERLLRRFAELNPAYQAGRIQPAIWREELLTRSGLLLPRSGRRAAFYHLSFQEFLAAERIARTSDDRSALESVFRNRGAVPEWRPTLLFLFAAQVFNYRDAQWGLDLLERLAADLERGGVKTNPSDTGGVGEDLAPFGEGAVGREQGGFLLVAARDDLKEQIGVAVGVGEVSDLVDEQQART